MSGAVALVLVLLTAALPWSLRRARPRPERRTGRRRRRRGVVGIDTAVLLDLLDVALASGASVPRALSALGTAVEPEPVSACLRAAGASLRLGATWEEAWHRCPAELRPLAAALEPAWTDGVDPGPAVRQAASTIRARRRRAAREAAEQLGARLVLPLGLCFLPAFVLLAMVPVLLSGAGAVLGP